MPHLRPSRRSRRLVASSLLALAAVGVPAATADAAAPRLLTSHDFVGSTWPSYAANWGIEGPDLHTPEDTVKSIGSVRTDVEDPSLPTANKGVAGIDAGDGLLARRLPERQSPDTYAIALSFRVGETDPDPAAGTRLPVLSFDGGASGTGVVIRDGVLGWWHAPSGQFTALGAIADGEWRSVVVSRAAGAVQLDQSGATASVDAAQSAPSTFEEATIFGPGAAAGQVARLRTWDAPLGPAALATVTASVVDDAAPRVGVYTTGAPVPATAPEIRSFPPDGAGIVTLDGERWTGRGAGSFGTVDDDGTAPITPSLSLHAGSCAGPSLPTADGGHLYLDEYDKSYADPTFAVTTKYLFGVGLPEAAEGDIVALCLAATDRRGNTGTEEVRVRVDATDPALTVDTPPSTGSAAFSGQVGTAPRDRAWVALELSGLNGGEATRLALDTATAGPDGRWTAQLRNPDGSALALVPGTYRLSVAQCDATGNCARVDRDFEVAAPRPAEPARPAGPARPPVVVIEDPVPPLATLSLDTLRRGGIRGLLRRRTVDVWAMRPGRVQVTVFKGAAPKRVATYRTTARGKGAAVPRTAISLGTATA
ncbi:MAG TPA: hypothetical protein VN238_17335, partial [Solirubrobacteraceae bacterium]|nr:hypothetical protein [Solirubrobacteraceae bacterium]